MCAFCSTRKMLVPWRLGLGSDEVSGWPGCRHVLSQALSRIICRWVPTTLEPQSPRFYNSTVIMACIVHVQAVAGGAACQSRAHNDELIGCPHKMLCPALCARIEQWHQGLRLGIKRCGEVVALAITALAGQREVVETM